MNHVSSESDKIFDENNNENEITFDQIEKIFEDVFKDERINENEDSIYDQDSNINDFKDLLAEFEQDEKNSNPNILYDSDSEIDPKQADFNFMISEALESLENEKINSHPSSSPILNLDSENLKNILDSPILNQYVSSTIPREILEYGEMGSSNDLSEYNSENEQILQNSEDESPYSEIETVNNKNSTSFDANSSPSTKSQKISKNLRKSKRLLNKSETTPTKNKKINRKNKYQFHLESDFAKNNLLKNPKKINTISKDGKTNLKNSSPKSYSTDSIESDSSLESELLRYENLNLEDDSEYEYEGYSSQSDADKFSSQNYNNGSINTNKASNSQFSKDENSKDGISKSLKKSTLLERLYDDSDGGSDSDSDVDAIEDNFLASLKSFGLSGTRGLKRSSIKDGRKEQKSNSDFIFDSDEKSDHDSEAESSYDELNIEDEAWKSVEEIVKFKKGDLDSIRSARSKKKKKNNPKKLDPEILNLLGKANVFYANKESQKSIILLKEVIRIDPSVSQAWHTLALIQEEAGDSDRALKLYLMSAHLAPSDPVLWKRIASLFSEKMNSYRNELEKLVGSKTDSIISGVEVLASPEALDVAKKYDTARDQTLYCLGKACVADKKDLDVWLQRLELFEQLQNNSMIGSCYSGILKIQPLNIALIRKALPLFVHTLNDTNQPIKWMSTVIKYYWFVNRKRPSKPLSEKRFNFSDLNMLIELRIVREEYEEAISDIKRASRLIQGRAHETFWEPLELEDIKDLEFSEDSNKLPIELIVKLGQCRLMLGHLETAKNHFEKLFELPVEGYADLYQDVASTYNQKKMFHESLSVYKKVIEDDDFNNSVVWAQMALLYKETNNYQSAIVYARASVEEDQDEVPMRVFLCEMYEKVGDLDSAIKMFSEVEEIREKTIDNELKTPTPGSYVKNESLDNSNWEVERLRYVPMPFFRRTDPQRKSSDDHSDENINNNRKENRDENKVEVEDEDRDDQSYSFEAKESFMVNTQESFLRVKTYKYTPLAIARIKAAEVVYRRQASSIRDAKLAFKKIKLLENKTLDEKSTLVISLTLSYISSNNSNTFLHFCSFQKLRQNSVRLLESCLMIGAE
ncbi:Transcription factor tau 131 kDa subunit [Smittium mucronatum]|uniref:Transcription factor tau 131 kDa subunit n=1 Tax=Smittium mucronatum TaxID=133383 RepID=A0A1R0H020_9FUNG|nr:Transcription factor tau 131 kDa subunit [Smittium mucronatum]